MKDCKGCKYRAVCVPIGQEAMRRRLFYCKDCKHFYVLLSDDPKSTGYAKSLRRLPNCFETWHIILRLCVDCLTEEILNVGNARNQGAPVTKETLGVRDGASPGTPLTKETLGFSTTARQGDLVTKEILNVTDVARGRDDEREGV